MKIWLAGSFQKQVIHTFFIKGGLISVSWGNLFISKKIILESYKELEDLVFHQIPLSHKKTSKGLLLKFLSIG